MMRDFEMLHHCAEYGTELLHGAVYAVAESLRLAVRLSGRLSVTVKLIVLPKFFHRVTF